MSNLLASIYVTRNSNQSTDDKIFVRNVGNQMVVYHTCGSSGIKSQVTLVHKSLPHYVNTLCKLYTTDTDPFDSIQFNFAGFPTYMVNRKSLDQPGVVDNLMSVASLVTASSFDVQEEGEVDEFADMPPLVCGSKNCSGNNCAGTLPCTNPCYINAY